jgi:UDP-2,3-diacylglucosamine pyrophosphatase LpxH
MLVIISDLHLGDGTTASSISPDAFHLFAHRLRETAQFASFRRDGSYRPIESLDLLLMGDILDPLHSTLWLEPVSGTSEAIRPWSDPRLPGYAAKLQEITRAVIRENRTGLEILGRLPRGEIVALPPASGGQPDFSAAERISPRVRLYYTVGNHDWYYHLPGPAFDAIRAEIIALLGLTNPVDNFPWKIEEYEELRQLFAAYRVYGQHGDIYDDFNFDKASGRNASSLGDAFTVEVLNRFAVQVKQEFGSSIPPAIEESLHRLANVRPVLATPLWINAQIKQNAGSRAVQNKLKKVWDQLSDEFLQIDYVRRQDKAFQFDLVDGLELVLKISKSTSFNTIDDVVIWVRQHLWGGEISFANHALREPAFLRNEARYIVYGHTHYPEIISLDLVGNPPAAQGQIYFNSGTWHSFYNLAIKNPQAKKFVPFQAMTYLAFYLERERGERSFEAWSGSFA